MPQKIKRMAVVDGGGGNGARNCLAATRRSTASCALGENQKLAEAAITMAAVPAPIHCQVRIALPRTL